MALKHLIIGCGHAATNAVEEIRMISSEDHVHVVTMEDVDPYSPTALPSFLSGKASEHGLLNGRERFFKKLNCQFSMGKKVTALNPNRKEVIYKEGESEKYDKLLIATGSSPVRPPIKGLAETGFLGIRTIGDCKKLLGLLKGKSKIIILGGGLVGVEVALGLSERGYGITIVEKESRLLPLYFDEDAESIIRESFLEQGFHLMTGMEVAGLNGKNGNIEVRLSNGDTLHSDVLVTCVGVKANTDFLKDTGIDVNKGIVVDRTMKTSVEDIYAAGDVAEAPDFFSSQPGMNPIILSAVEQGRVAGSNMAGVKVSYKGWTAGNIFTFFGHRAFSVGLSMVSGESYQIYQETNAHRKQYKKMVFDHGRLVGASGINIDVYPGVLLSLIENRVDVGEKRQMLFDHPGTIGLMLKSKTEEEVQTSGLKKL